MIDSLTARYYGSIQDLHDMRSMLMEARAKSADWRFWHVGELAWAFFMVDCHLDPHQHIRLWHTSRKRLVAFAILGEDPSFDCQVLPEFSGEGLEVEALAWAHEKLAVLRQENVKAWGCDLVTGVRQDDIRRIAFLEQNGFRYRGKFAEVNMMRLLDDSIPESPLPEGFQVRGLRQEEIPSRADAERIIWQPWTVGNVRDEDYARLQHMPGYERELDVVAVAPGGTIAAYVNCWLDPVNGIGDFGPVGALPDYRRMGLTRAVLLEGMRRLQERGMNRVCVSTGVLNTPATRLYESVGFRIVNQYLDYGKAA